MKPENFEIKCKKCGSNDVEVYGMINTRSTMYENGRASIVCKNCGANDFSKQPDKTAPEIEIPNKYR